MKAKFSLMLLGACGLLLAAPATPVRAGSVVATDDYGGCGYAYGDKPLEALRHKAIHDCREVSDHPERVHVYVETERPGYTIVVRFKADGKTRVYALVGYDSADAAYAKCMRIVKEYEGYNVEILQRWKDQ